MRILTQLARLIVGALFIYSGWVKANDSIGFAYKLVEYFEVFGAEFLVPYAVPITMLICILEMVLGLTLLIGARANLTRWLLLLLAIFFTFLTFYSAYFNKIISYGSFGEALKLTSWQSFGIDAVLLILIIILFIGREHIQPIFGPKLENALTLTTLIASIIFPIYTYNFLPVKDYQPYAIGKNIPEQMKGTPDELKYRYKVKDKKSGEVKMLDKLTADYDTNYDLIESVTEVVRKGIKPGIRDFSIFNLKGEDYTRKIIENTEYNFLLICYDLDKANKDAFGKVNDFAILCKQNHTAFVALTSSTKQQIKRFKEEVQTNIDFYTAEEMVLKTMIRSNPGLMLLKAGTVVDKWHYHSMPAYTDVKQKYFNK